MADEFESIQPGPWIAAAFLCEKVIQEKDGVLSFIRVVDRFGRPKPTAQIPPQPIQVTLVITFRNGGVPSGNYTVRMTLYKPNTSTPATIVEQQVFLEGMPDQGANIIVPMAILADEDGLFWLDVHFADQLLTRVPFRVILLVAPSVQPFPPHGA